MKRGKSRGVGARAAFGSADDLNKETKSGAFNQLPSPQPQAQPSSDVRSTTTQPHPLTPSSHPEAALLSPDVHPHHHITSYKIRMATRGNNWSSISSV